MICYTDQMIGYTKSIWFATAIINQIVLPTKSSLKKPNYAHKHGGGWKMFFLWTSGWCSSSIFVLQACTIYVVVEPLVSKKNMWFKWKSSPSRKWRNISTNNYNLQFCNCDLFGMGRWPFQTSSGIQQGVNLVTILNHLVVSFERIYSSISTFIPQFWRVWDVNTL